MIFNLRIIKKKFLKGWTCLSIFISFNTRSSFICFAFISCCKLLGYSQSDTFCETPLEIVLKILFDPLQTFWSESCYLIYFVFFLSFEFINCLFISISSFHLTIIEFIIIHFFHWRSDHSLKSTFYIFLFIH